MPDLDRSESAAILACPLLKHMLLKRLEDKSERERVRAEASRAHANEVMALVIGDRSNCVPFAGNGIKICRLLELGRCPRPTKESRHV
jgi:hypothetical protein